MPPPIPYVVSGTVYKGPLEGSTSVTGTVGSTGSQTVDVYVGGAAEKVSGVTVTLTHPNGTLTTTTDSNGRYSINLGNLSSYSVGDSFTVTVNTITTADLADSSLLVGIRPVHIVDRSGEGHTELYPLSVQIANDAVPKQNPSKSFTYNSSKQVTQIDMNIEGVVYRKTFSYNTDKTIATESRWEKV